MQGARMGRCPPTVHGQRPDTPDSGPGNNIAIKIKDMAVARFLH